MLGVVLGERKKRLEYYLYWARTIFRREDLTMTGFYSINLRVLGGRPNLPLIKNNPDRKSVV